MIRYLSICFFFLAIEAGAQEIAITFDDAPTADGPIFPGNVRSQMIVDHLKAHDVQAVAFFVLTGQITEENKGRLHRYSGAGHTLANHSHTHMRIHALGTQGYIEDVKRADTVLSAYTAYERWFRFPFLDEGRTENARDSIRRALTGVGLSNGYVTVDNYDWYLNHLLAQARKENRKINMQALRDIYLDHIYESVKFYDDIARKHLGRSPRHVLLLHENDLAALFVGDLIAKLKDNGWRIITPQRAYSDPIATQLPNVLFNGQGRVAAIAREKGVAARDLVQESEDETFLDELVKRRKVFE